MARRSGQGRASTRRVIGAERRARSAARRRPNAGAGPEGVFARWLRSLGLFALVAVIGGCGAGEAPVAPGRSAEYLQATRHYGPLVVREGRTPVHESTVRPWSSYWFPKAETTLFDGPQSPLAKYDAYLKTLQGRAGQSARLERQSWEGQRWDSWEGHCDAWALASVIHQPEPTAVELPGGVSLTAEDAKALIVKTYERVFLGPDGRNPLLYFGHRYNGLAGQTPEERQPDDILPDQFHRVLQAELAEARRPVIMDKDPDLPVWNHPIHAFYSEIAPVPGRGELDVTTFVLFTNVRQRFVGDLLAEEAWKEYTYRLRGRRLPGGAWRIESGEWTGASVKDHPDFLTVIPEGFDRAQRRSLNGGVDAAIVDAMLAPRG